MELFRESRAAGVETAVAAAHLRAAVSALEDVIGLVTSDDVLESGVLDVLHREVAAGAATDGNGRTRGRGSRHVSKRLTGP